MLNVGKQTVIEELQEHHEPRERELPALDRQLLPAKRKGESEAANKDLGDRRCVLT